MTSKFSLKNTGQVTKGKKKKKKRVEKAEESKRGCAQKKLQEFAWRQGIKKGYIPACKLFFSIIKADNICILLCNHN